MISSQKAREITKKVEERLPPQDREYPDQLRSELNYINNRIELYASIGYYNTSLVIEGSLANKIREILQENGFKVEFSLFEGIMLYLFNNTYLPRIYISW